MNSNSSQHGRRLPILLMTVFSLILASGLFWLSKTSTAIANTPDIALAENTYPAIKNTRIDTCALCHTSAPNLNPYGAAYKAAGRGFASSLTGIESADSDNDGFSNIVEINALTFPGDAADHPAAPATATTAPTATSVPPTATSVPPTGTSVPPTATSQGPTSTQVPATATSQGPTATKGATATKQPTEVKGPTATRRVELSKTPGPRPTPVVQCVKDDDLDKKDLSSMSQKERDDRQRVNPCPPGYHPRDHEWTHKSNSGSSDDFFTKALKKISSWFQGNKKP